MNLSGYIESVLNPHGRFMTLDGIYALRDEDGEPLMAVTSESVDFEVVWHGKPHSLRCMMDMDSRRADRLRELALYTQHIGSKHLAPFFYLDHEMVVFDSSDTPLSVDVVLQRLPDGERADRISEERFRNGNPGPLALAKEQKALASLAAWLAGSDFTHGNICMKNVYITPSGDAVLVNYAHSSHGHPSRHDIQAIGTIIAALHMAASSDDMYDTVTQCNYLAAGYARRLMRILAYMPDGGGEAGELLELIMAVDEEDDNDATVRELCDAIVRMSQAEPHCDAPQRSSAETDDGTKWNFIGEMREMVIRVFDGHAWRYIDKTGRAAFDGAFIYANDFAEGRAVVETSKGYGMIDLDGRFVIEPHCDDIEWDSSCNVAVVTVDGQSGLFDRNGMPLTGLIYDQILSCSEGLFPVKKDRLFGFVGRDGRIAIRPQYDDAFGFRNGHALVRNGVHNFMIDPKGHIIENMTANAMAV